MTTNQYIRALNAISREVSQDEVEAMIRAWPDDLDYLRRRLNKEIDDLGKLKYKIESLRAAIAVKESA